MSGLNSTEQLIIPWKKGRPLAFARLWKSLLWRRRRERLEKCFAFLRGTSFIMSCCWRLKRKSPDGLHWWGQAHIRVSAKLSWCDVTCREITGCGAGGSLAESPKAPGATLVGQFLSEDSLMGGALLCFCLKTNLKAIQQFCCFLLSLTLTAGAAYVSPRCLKATFQSGLDSVHVSSRQFVM